jgi:staphylococcal nuclease domain-containing protein 1
MPIKEIKIGYNTTQGTARHLNSASQKTFLTAEMMANLIQPFPAPSSPPKERHTEPSPLQKPVSRTLKSIYTINPLPNIPAANYTMVLNQAKVKSVLSGDSLILSSIAHPERERTLSLAYCSSPHLKKEGDEQFAFESRDALRQMVVGKNVQFQVLYTIPNTKREYGIVFLNDGRRLPEEMVKLGWLKLRDDAGRKEDTEEALKQLDELRLLEAKARADDLGLWQPSGGRIEVQHDMGNSQEFLETWKGKSVDGIVERVLSGDRMLVRLMVSPTLHYQGRGLSVSFCAAVCLYFV